MADYIGREQAITEIIKTYEYEFPTASGAFDEFVTRILPNVLKGIPAADVAPVRHGRWMFEAHKEKVNCRWNVTAECSECCDQINEVWAGFFTGVPDWLARDTALLYAKEVKLDNYCANCGADMRGSNDE